MSTGAPGVKTVLVVEDDQATRTWLATVLQRAGYAVDQTANGREALDRLRGGLAPDLILLDMLMPVLDGWHFLEQLKQLGPAAPVPVLVATATILTREWAAQHGCAGFVRKPIEEGELLAEVRRCLAAANPGLKEVD